jgi:hypothetical protein
MNGGLKQKRCGMPMATLIHEIWKDEDNMEGVCLAGPDGDDFRRLLGSKAKCVRRFEAGSHFEAMTIYYHLCSRGTYTSDFAADRDPYPDDWAQRQAAFARRVESSM